MKKKNMNTRIMRGTAGTLMLLFHLLYSLITYSQSIQLIKKDTLVVTGEILNKTEIWDSRANPMMGRPNFLKEIRLTVQVTKIISSTGPAVHSTLPVSVKGQQFLIRFKGVQEGQNGVFTLQGSDTPYVLIKFDTLPGKRKPPVKKVDTIKTTQSNNRQNTGNSGKLDPLAEYEQIGGKKMKDSASLQKKAVSTVARKYNMKNAEFITLTSFSGPCPPEGGYVYWGVRGQVNGTWYVWQPGKNGRLSEGRDLEDPQRYQKCLSPQTMILTPSGTVAVSSLKKGDLVISRNNKPVPILEVSKVKAGNHHVCRTTFDDGTVLEISPGHPLADGRTFGSLNTGDFVNGTWVV